MISQFMMQIIEEIRFISRALAIISTDTWIECSLRGVLSKLDFFVIFPHCIEIMRNTLKQITTVLLLTGHEHPPFSHPKLNNLCS
jgi:hypothetical protein